jgi:hypothetical protein
LSRANARSWASNTISCVSRRYRTIEARMVFVRLM